MRLLLALLTLFALVFSEAGLAQSVQGDNRQMLAPPDEWVEPYNNGYMVSQSVPQTMLVNGLYNVSVTMENTGSLLWYRSNQYRLGSVAPHDNWTWGLHRVELPVEVVGSGERAQFNFQVRAPSTPGTYTFQWNMVQDGREWFGGATTPVTVTVREPINNASYVSHYQTTQMQTGQRYDVSVTMHNNGETTWSRALHYTLMAQAPHNNTTWGFNRVPLPVEEVRPGESVTFNFAVTAPATAGSYISQWGMQREWHGSFGASTAPVTVGVVAPPPLVNNAQVVNVNVPARMQTRLRYNVAVTMQNTGTTTWAAGSNYNLGSLNPRDNGIWGLGRVTVGTAVAPGQQYTFHFTVTAPEAGSYDMQWGMVQDGVGWFGGTAGKPVFVTEDLSRTTFIHTDGLGSPVARTDGAGTVISRTRYEPYGYVASGATPTIGFTGHVNDADTGLTYMQQRYYDPVAGRFLSIDPVTTDANTGGSFNRYAYANNNPYKYIDPDGRQAAMAACGLGPGGCVFGIVATIVGAKAISDTIHAAQNQSGGGKTSPAVGQGCIYCVPGDKTSSGKDYIGSTDDLYRRSKDSSDGRDRRGADVINTYPVGDREERRKKEQQAINDKGGVSETDNRRNEIRETKWGEKGVTPPPPKPPGPKPQEPGRN